MVERFVRLEGARSRPGFGLGLSLAAAVARLHGGTLRLEDNEPGLELSFGCPPARSKRRRAAHAAVHPLSAAGCVAGPAETGRMSAPWTLAERVTKAPRLTSAKTARRAMAEFRAGLSPQNASYPLAELLDRHPLLDALLTGLADHSPYLWRLAVG